MEPTLTQDLRFTQKGIGKVSGSSWHIGRFYKCVWAPSSWLGTCGKEDGLAREGELSENLHVSTLTPPLCPVFSGRATTSKCWLAEKVGGPMLTAHPMVPQQFVGGEWDSGEQLKPTSRCRDTPCGVSPTGPDPESLWPILRNTNTSFFKAGLCSGYVF